MLIDPCDFDLLYTLLNVKWSKLNDDDIPGRCYQDSLESVFDLEIIFTLVPRTSKKLCLTN